MFAKTLSIAGLLLLTVFFAACGATTNPNPYAQYKPVLLPVRFTISTSGVSVVSDASIVTPLGEFSVGAEYSLARQDDSIIVIIRDRRRGEKGFDSIYRVRTGTDEFTAVVNGKTTVQVTNRQVQIDVTDGSVESIELKSVSPTIAETDTSFAQRYDIFWNSAPFHYHPLGLARWAYDDSTMSKWYGIGFLWFLIRLMAAVLLGFIDILVIVFFGIGNLIYVFAGLTASNIFYGLAPLFVVFLFLRITQLRNALNSG